MAGRPVRSLTFRLRLCGARALHVWNEPRGAGSSQLRAAYRYIGKLLTGRGAAEHDAAAAHIAATNEFGGKQQAVLEHFEQRRGVLGAGHTSQQDEGALTTGGGVE